LSRAAQPQEGRLETGQQDEILPHKAAEPQTEDDFRRLSVESSACSAPHGLIQKVPKTHRYQLTPTGRLAINPILTMHQTSLSLLN
jgi:hypothetical protein